MRPLAREALERALRSFERQRVLVVGDVIADVATIGSVERISPEAPVPVVAVSREAMQLGGAANVAHQVDALGGSAHLVGVVGDDAAGGQLRDLLEEAGIAAVLVVDEARPTTVKHRVVADGQQLLRLDVEVRRPVAPPREAELVGHLDRLVPQVDAVVVSDYGKGAVTCGLLDHLGSLCDRHGVPVLVDPTLVPFDRYGRSTIKANQREFEVELGASSPSSVQAIAEASVAVVRRRELRSLIVTLGARGMVVTDGERWSHLPARAHQVFDVTGAGDTVAAVLALSLAGGTAVFEAAALANAAAGEVVRQLGTAVVTAAALRAAVGGGPQPLDAVIEGLAPRRAAGETVAFANGCFDILHAGHLELLRHAADEADVLVVGINSDASVARLKGPQRPIVTALERAAMLSGLGYVDAVVVFDDDTPLAVIDALGPDVLVKGDEYRRGEVVGADIVEDRGGRVVLVPMVDDRSTSGLIDRLRGEA